MTMQGRGGDLGGARKRARSCDRDWTAKNKLKRKGRYMSKWKCPKCGSAEGTWFDRCLDHEGNMNERCRACGVAL